MSLELGLMALTKVIGLPYAEATVKRNEIIRFVPEPDNDFDEHAIRAENQGGETVGYVARRLPKTFNDYPAYAVWNNELMNKIIARDKAFSGKVIEVTDKYLLVTIHECCKCDECRFNQHSGLKKYDCFHKEFWIDDVLARKEIHFVDGNNRVLGFTFGEGGFGNYRYKVKLENGEILENIGLWHRGTAPEYISKKLQKGIIL